MRPASRTLAAFGILLLSGCSQPQSPPFRPVADVKEIMRSIVDPAAGDVWSASGWITTKEGTVERGPSTSGEWTEIRKQAVTLTEAGNLLMIAPRAKDSGQWMALARALVDKGEECVKAAEQKNKQRMFDVGGDLYQTCLNCHQQYLPAIQDAVRAQAKKDALR
jgi:hypothetical protein